MRTIIITFLAFLAFTPVAFAQCVPTQANDYCFGQPGTTVGGTQTKCVPTQANDYCFGQPGTTVGGTQTTVNPGAGQTTVNPGTVGTNITLVNPLGAGVGLMELLNKILAFVIQIGTIVVIFMLVYVGYLFVVAQGEPAKITAARQALLWTVVGALILLGSQAIAFGIQATVQALSVGK